MGTGSEYPLSNIFNMIMRPVLFNDIRFIIVDAMVMNKKSNLSFGAHMHPCYECVHVCNGMFFTYANDRHLITTEGKCSIIAPGVPHSHYLDDADSEIYSIRFLLEKVTPETANGAECTLCYDRIAEHLSDSLYDYPSQTIKMLEDLKGKPIYSQQAILIHWLLSFMRDREEIPEKITQEKKVENIVEHVELYLNEFYMNNITVTDIANSLNISYRHLARIYKAARGMTFIEKLTAIRIDNAKKALVETQKPIKQVALEFGFSNEYYFATLFKKTTGCTPTEYRQRYKTTD